MEGGSFLLFLLAKEGQVSSFRVYCFCRGTGTEDVCGG